MGLALDDSGHGVGVDFSSWEPCGGGVVVGFLLLDSVWSSWAWSLSRWILFGVRGFCLAVALVFMIRAGRGMHPPAFKRVAKKLFPLWGNAAALNPPHF